MGMPLPEKEYLRSSEYEFLNQSTPCSEYLHLEPVFQTEDFNEMKPHLIFSEFLFKLSFQGLGNPKGSPKTPRNSQGPVFLFFFVFFCFFFLFLC